MDEHLAALVDPTEQLLAEQPVQLVRQGSWRALWIAPSRSKAEPTWVIATALGPMDQRSLIYRQPNAGYAAAGAD